MTKREDVFTSPLAEALTDALAEASPHLDECNYGDAAEAVAAYLRSLGYPVSLGHPTKLPSCPACGRAATGVIVDWKTGYSVEHVADFQPDCRVSREVGQDFLHAVRAATHRDT